MRKPILRFIPAFVCLGTLLVQPLQADSTAELTLTNGWNLISLPVQPFDSNILKVLAPIRGRYQAVWTYADGHWQGFNPSVAGLADLKSMRAGQAYWVQMRHDAVLKVKGLAPVNAPNSYAGQSLRPGWNLLGYSSGVAQDVTDSFAPIAGQLDLAAARSAAGWLWYQPGNPSASTLASVSPFRGLWVHVTTNGTWLAPNYRGAVVDAATGQPIVGATVALDGIEAEGPSDAQGTFLVAGVSDSATQLLTVAAPGYAPNAIVRRLSAPTAPAMSALAYSKKDLQSAGTSLTTLPSPFVADVLIPQNNSVWLQPEACGTPGLTIKGYTTLQNQSNFLYDIVFVIDTSASTARGTGYDLNGDGREDTVFEAEVEACRRLARSLTDSNHIRFGAVKFARYSTKNAPDGSISDGPIIPAETRIVQTLTTYSAALQAALDSVAGEGATGGTDIGAGIDLAVQALTNAPPVGGDFRVTPVRHIILFSDGMPTLPVESGYTQEHGDRVATLEAAQRAVAANIAIHPVVFDPTNQIERKLTTMPAVQAITGVPGELLRINTNNIQQLPDLLSQMALTSIPAISVLDHTSGTNWNITVQPNGWFEALLPVAIGTNNWEFRFSSGNVTNTQTITRSISFVVYPSTADLDVVSLSASNPPVRDLTYLESPAGSHLYDSGPELSLLSVLTNKVPEARVLPGVESFRSLSGTMTLEFIFKGAGYNSDVGYFLFDPGNPPKTAAEVIVGLDQTNVFLNSGVVSNNSLNVSGLVNTLQVPPGVAVGLFMIPNGTLADAQAAAHGPCVSFPIALSSNAVANASPGTILSNIWNGSQAGNFGWLSWTGDSDESNLVNSLTLPGDSSTYINPDDPADHQLLVGDWVSGRPGVANGKNVRKALDALTNSVIVVPVWDQVRGKGDKTAYHVCNFATVQIISYQLPAKNRITARFLGFANCGKRVNPPLFTLASLNPGQFDQALTFYDPVASQIICAFEDVDIMSSHSDLDFQDLVFTVKPIDPMPQSAECFAP